MKKELEIIIKFIQNSKTNNHRLASFFARKYSEKLKDKQDECIKS